MGFGLTIAGAFVVVLVIAFLMDRRSRRVRGGVPRVRQRHGIFGPNTDARTKLPLARVIGGRYQGRNMDDPPEPTDRAG